MPFAHFVSLVILAVFSHGVATAQQVADRGNPVAQRDAISGQAPEVRRILEDKAATAQKRYQRAHDLDSLKNGVAEAYAKKDAVLFYFAVNDLNKRLLQYAASDDIEDKVEGASLLLEQMRIKRITKDDFAAAQKLFEEELAQSKTCSSLKCNFLAYAVQGLAFPSEYTRPNELPVIGVNKEIPTISSDKLRLGTFKTLAQRNWGSDESGAVMGPAILRSVTVLGSVKDLNEAAASLVNEQTGMWGRGQNKVYKSKNWKTQKAAMDALADLGPRGQEVLKKFAFNNITFDSRYFANIALAYTPLNEADSAKNKANLKEIYCHTAFGIESQEDMQVHREVAYAYGRGSKPEYVTARGSDECLVTYPSEPDQRLVAKEWSDTVMSFVSVDMATLFLMPALTTGKWALRVEGFMGKLKTPFQQFPKLSTWSDFATEAATTGAKTAKAAKAEKVGKAAWAMTDAEKAGAAGVKAGKTSKAVRGAEAAKKAEAAKEAKNAYKYAEASTESGARWKAADAYEEAAKTAAERKAGLEKMRKAEEDIIEAEADIKAAKKARAATKDENMAYALQKDEWAAEKRITEAKKTWNEAEKAVSSSEFKERSWVNTVRSNQDIAARLSGGTKASDVSAAARVATEKANDAARAAKAATAEKAAAEKLASQTSRRRAQWSDQSAGQNAIVRKYEKRIEELSRPKRGAVDAEDAAELAELKPKYEAASRKAAELEREFRVADNEYKAAQEAVREAKIRIAQAEQEIYMHLGEAERAASRTQSTAQNTAVQPAV